MLGYARFIFSCVNYCVIFDSMLWRTLCKSTATYEFPVVARDYFDKLVLIWWNQCQSVNRRLFAAVKVEADSEVYEALLQSASQLVDTLPSGEECEARKLIPKDSALFSQNCYEVSYREGDLDVVFVPLQLDIHNGKKTPHIPYPYRISCQQTTDSSLQLMISVPMKIADTESHWVLNTVFPSLFKWLRFMDPQKSVRKTNSLLDIEEYSLRYKRIKEDYGRNLVEKWTEKTDPKKFVYEDCGIAAYLLFWRKRDCFPRKFADLGCGNGLLVHLLNKEGVNGIGIDLRKRKIWSDLLSDTSLVEAAINPSQEENSVPPDVDYLIGNHTDELTPWIPIMAARRNCNFFVLPCCPFNFHGKYVARPGDNGSQYDSFLKFVREVCTRLGFVVEEDRLSIPSTKRLCYVCNIPPHGLVPNVEEVIEELTGSGTKAFLPRPKVEQIRNCLNVPPEIRLALTKRFFDKILLSSNELRDGWRCGGAIELGELVLMLTETEKQLMKQQCGGLQTFLRNQHQVFKVTGGMARLRDFREESSRKPKKSNGVAPRNGMTPCWMAEYHPDGCPMKDKCQFKH